MVRCDVRGGRVLYASSLLGKKCPLHGLGKGPARCYRCSAGRGCDLLSFIPELVVDLVEDLAVCHFTASVLRAMDAGRGADLSNQKFCRIEGLSRWALVAASFAAAEAYNRSEVPKVSLKAASFEYV